MAYMDRKGELSDPEGGVWGWNRGIHIGVECVVELFLINNEDVWGSNGVRDIFFLDAEILDDGDEATFSGVIVDITDTSDGVFTSYETVPSNGGITLFSTEETD